MVALTLHAANRLLERDIPCAAVDICRLILPLLNENPLRFRYRDLVIVAAKSDGRPRIISVWKVDA